MITLRKLIYSENFANSGYFVWRYGTLKLLLTPKGSDSNYTFLSLVLQVDFLGRYIAI